MPDPTAKSRRGPKTAEGKRKCSLNALKHGLNARSPQALRKLAEEREASLEDIQQRMRLHYRPVGPVEEELVRRIGRCVWRLSISAAMEERLMERQPNAPRPGVTYEHILKYERLVDIHLHRALSALEYHRRLSTPTAPPPPES